MSTIAINRARFRGALQHYRKERSLSVRELSVLLQKPTWTVYQWLSGWAAPWPKDWPLVCQRLNWNYNKLLSRRSPFAKIFNSDVLDPAFVSERFKQLNKSNTADSSFVLLAAVSVFNHFLKRGIVCELHVTCSLEARIFVTGLEGLAVWLKADYPGEGIKVRVYSAFGEPQGREWLPLSKESLDILARSFKKVIKNHVSTTRQRNSAARSAGTAAQNPTTSTGHS